MAKQQVDPAGQEFTTARAALVAAYGTSPAVAADYLLGCTGTQFARLVNAQGNTLLVRVAMAENLGELALSIATKQPLEDEVATVVKLLSIQADAVRETEQEVPK